MGVGRRRVEGMEEHWGIDDDKSARKRDEKRRKTHERTNVLCGRQKTKETSSDSMVTSRGGEESQKCVWAIKTDLYFTSNYLSPPLTRCFSLLHREKRTTNRVGRSLSQDAQHPDSQVMFHRKTSLTARGELQRVLFLLSGLSRK